MVSKLYPLLPGNNIWKLAKVQKRLHTPDKIPPPLPKKLYSSQVFAINLCHTSRTDVISKDMGPSWNGEKEANPKN